MNSLLNIFEEERTCEYRDDIYCVRDNGAVYRYSRENKRLRKLDNQWTFGKPNNHGYMLIASEVVHRIVATAFHGEPPTKNYVVDHIDTNRQNNRPENLRWKTRLENIILNPITLSRIIYQYGTIDNFLANPSQPLNGKLEENFSWMRTVTKEEAENTKFNLLKWAKKGSIPKGSTLDRWIFSKQEKDSKNEIIIEEPIVQSLTSNTVQKKWKTPSEFPNCPSTSNDNAMAVYKQKLIKGAVFSKNKYGESIVERSEINEDLNELFVITKSNNVTPDSLAKIFVEENVFVHETVHSFFTLIGAQKQFTLSLGLKWDGEDSIDDYS